MRVWLSATSSTYLSIDFNKHVFHQNKTTDMSSVPSEILPRCITPW